MDESDFDRTYVPEHLTEKVRNWRNLSIGERFALTYELSEAAWARIGVVSNSNGLTTKAVLIRPKKN